MTKSQNTKNEQLTEQWKQKKLPLGWYFVKDEAGKIDYAEYTEWFNADGWCGNYFECEEEIVEVLAEAPDYIDWQNMVNCACEEHKANTELLEEIARLKELLLKECRDEIDPYIEVIGGKKTFKNLIDKIYEVLK